jgi:TATA-box binding protein (TBP) (component of TFIID and TFIIIB)
MQLDLSQTADRLERLGEGKVESNPFLVSFTTGQHRLVIFQDGRVLVHGTKDTAEARTMVHRYFG